MFIIAGQRRRHHALPAPVLDYQFRDGSGTSVADSSGDGRTGTIYGDATWGSGGLTLGTSSYVLVPTTIGGLGVGSAGTIAVHGSVSATYPAGIVTQTTVGVGWDFMMGYRTGGDSDYWYGVGGAGLSGGAYTPSVVTRVARWGGGTLGYRVGAGTEATAATTSSPSNSSGAQLRIGTGLSWTAPGTRVVRRVTIWSVRLTNEQIAAWEASL